jgi:hypothetical protein
MSVRSNTHHRTTRKAIDRTTRKAVRRGTIDAGWLAAINTVMSGCRY